MRRLAVVSSTLFALLFPGGAQAWAWPIDGPVLRPFVFGSDPYAAGQHRGIDVGGAVGDSVRAPVAGTVSFAGSVPAGGRALTIRTGDGYSVTLLQLGSIAVQRGDEVGEGARVGAVGESADAVTREPHVHLGVRRTADEEGYLDPLAFLPERPRVVVPAPAPAASPPPVQPQPAPPAAARRAARASACSSRSAARAADCPCSPDVERGARRRRAGTGRRRRRAEGRRVREAARRVRWSDRARRSRARARRAPRTRPIGRRSARLRLPAREARRVADAKAVAAAVARRRRPIRQRVLDAVARTLSGPEAGRELGVRCGRSATACLDRGARAAHPDRRCAGPDRGAAEAGSYHGHG